MDRRPAGIVMLVVALVVVAVVPSITGRRIAGSAVPTTFPDPPKPGDCLLSELPAALPDSGVPPRIRVTAARFGPCVGPVGGEIVAVWATEADAAAAPQTRSSGPCYGPAADFAGLEWTGRATDLPDAPTAGPVRWRATINLDPFHVVPGARERNAGRTWVACLAVPASQASYLGTLRDAFTTGAMPSAFGSCWTAADLDMVPAPVGCDEPHPAELLAIGRVRDRVDASADVIHQSCSAVAGRIMRTDDPTRGGELQVVADQMTSGVVSRPDAPLTIGCFVTSQIPQRLSGTVVGLADRPVPIVE